MEQIIAYLQQKYQPIGMIVYGSNNSNSDFDALLITEFGEESHDSSVISETELDVWIRPKNLFELDKKINCEDYVQIESGKVVLDLDG